MERAQSLHPTAQVVSGHCFIGNTENAHGVNIIYLGKCLHV